MIGFFAAGAVHAGETQTLFDPGLHDSTITLVNSGRDAEGNANNAGLALSVAAKSGGRYYAEFELIANAASANTAFSCGIRGTTSGLGTYLGSDSTAYGSWVDGSNRSERSTYNNAIRSNIMTGQSSPPPGTRCRVAVDVGVGVWLSRWGASGWIGGGDPELGTGPTYALPAGTYRLAANPRGNGGRLRLVLPADWLHTPPFGFGVWG